MSQPSPPFDFAPDTGAFYQRDPEPAFAYLRAHDPVHWYERGRIWCLTRQAEIREVSRMPRVFSSAHGTQMFQIPIVQAGGTLVPAGMDDAVGGAYGPSSRRSRCRSRCW